jgi:hypothetical protein
MSWLETGTQNYLPSKKPTYIVVSDKNPKLSDNITERKQ